MPYRLSGKCVEVYKDGRWQTKKCYDDTIKARALLVALKVNVESKEKHLAERKGS